MYDIAWTPKFYLVPKSLMRYERLLEIKTFTEVSALSPLQAYSACLGGYFCYKGQINCSFAFAIIFWNLNDNSLNISSNPRPF